MDAHSLYNVLGATPLYYSVDAIGKYTSPIQCYFDHVRFHNARGEKKEFYSRGMFKISSSLGQAAEECLQFISGNDFSDYTMTSFHISTIQGVIKECFFHTVLVPSIPQPRIDDDDDGYFNYFVTSKRFNISLEEERVLIEEIINYLTSLESGLVITGWCVNDQYRELSARARICGVLREDFQLPVWKLSVDASKDCREFLRPVLSYPISDPPSPRLEDLAQALYITEGAPPPHYDNAASATLLFHERLNTIPNLLQILQLADLSPTTSVSSRNTITRVATTFLTNFFQSVVIAPIVFERNRKVEKIPVRGGTVFQPIKGVYLKSRDYNIGCVDYQSLYPSIMKTFGIMRGYVTCISDRPKKNNNDEDYFITMPNEEKDRYYLSLARARVIDDDDDDDDDCYRRFPVPIQTLCHFLICKRRVANNIILSRALKLITNTIYGLFLVEGFPLYDPVAASFITRCGRYYLRKAREFIETGFPGTRCLYGDTDSLFLLTPNTVEEIVTAWNQRIPSPIRLAVDEEFSHLILIRKKLYLARSIISGEFKFSGFPKRLMPLVHKTMTTCLSRLLREEAAPTPKVFLDTFHELFFTDNHHRQYSIFRKASGRSIYKISSIMKAGESAECELYDPSLHTLDKNAVLLEYLGNTFNALLELLKLSPLERLLVFPNNNVALIKYVLAGYACFDFSGDVSTARVLKLDISGILPDISHFMDGDAQKEKRGYHFLEATLHQYHHHNDQPYLTLNDTANSPRFYCLKDLEESLSWVLRCEVKKKKKKRPRDDDDGFPTLDDIIVSISTTSPPCKFLNTFFGYLCVFFNKSLTWMDKELLTPSHDHKKYLFRLPSIAIRIEEGDSDTSRKFAYLT